MRQTGTAKHPILMLRDAFPAEVSSAARTARSRLSLPMVNAALLGEVFHYTLLVELARELTPEPVPERRGR